MKNATDFSTLYRELGIEPEAGVDALHRAYRRSLKRLHPDTGDGHGDGETVDLSWLVRDYRRALAFHDAHGRLPGTRDHHLPRRPVELQRAREASPSAIPIQENLSWAGPFSRLVQILVVVTMVVIGIGLLLP